MAPSSRNAILDGAGRAFGRLGYGACRVEDIIEEAGVSRATFYKFFDGKEQVFEAVDEAFSFSFMHAMGAALDPEMDARDQAEALLDAYLRWISGWRELARTIWTDPTRPNAHTMRDARDEAFAAYIQVTRDLCNADGAPEVDELVYRGLLAAISEIGIWLTEKPRHSEKDLIRARAAIAHLVATVVTTPLLDPVPRSVSYVSRPVAKSK